MDKLAPFTYINKFDYHKWPYNEPYFYNESKISNNKYEPDYLRKLDNKEKPFKYDFININNKKYLRKLVNKKLRQLEEYNSKMGAITKNDITDYLMDMQFILSFFNESYLDKDYKNINRTFNSFFTINKDNYLFKLKRSIEMSALKFSTILTEESYNILKNNMYIQYNQIELYINSHLDLININKEKFINLLNDSSIFLELIYNLSYQRVQGYYSIFSELIQKKLKYLSDNDLKSTSNRKLSNDQKVEEKDIEDEDDDRKEFPDLPNWKDENKDKGENKNNNEEVNNGKDNNNGSKDKII